MLYKQDSLVKALYAEGPAQDRARHMMLYGQFIGSWDGSMVYQQFRIVSGNTTFDDQGARHETSCEVHFGWVLEGKAIQDVWIAPSRQMRQGGPAQDLMYGTTLRVYDPESNLWSITWIDPVTKSFNRMTGRKIGDDIVQ